MARPEEAAWLPHRGMSKPHHCQAISTADAVLCFMENGAFEMCGVRVKPER